LHRKSVKVSCPSRAFGFFFFLRQNCPSKTLGREVGVGVLFQNIYSMNKLTVCNKDVCISASGEAANILAVGVLGLLFLAIVSNK
jgi:hypothetical protein